MSIPYTDMSLNPFVGCSPISEGCDNCWAKRIAARFGHKDFKNPRYYIERWDKLTNKPKRIALCFMGDLFYEKIDKPKIEHTIHMCKVFSQHTFFVLTKRPQNAVQYKFPDNVWFGVTIENQQTYLERIYDFALIQAKNKWVCFEPLLSYINILNIKKTSFINWAVIGCESINGRPGRFADEFINAAKNIIQQCDKLQVPVYVKQIPFNGKICDNIDLFPPELKRQEYQ